MCKKVILFASHDPGAANVVLAIATLLDENTPLVALALGPSIGRFQAALGQRPLIPASEPVPGFPMESHVLEGSLCSILEEVKPAAILTGTSFNSNLDWSIWRWALGREVPCACILDFWSGYRLRFTRGGQAVLPDRVFVSDQAMANGMQDTWPGYSGTVVAGNPHLNSKMRAIWKARRGQDSKAILRKVRFFSENIHHYYPERHPNEFDFIRMLLDYSEGKLDEIVVRPHPMEDERIWNAWISGSGATSIPVRLDRSPIEEALADSSHISVGISSMALIESALAGIPTYSLQIDLDRPEDYLFIPFDEYGIRPVKSRNEIATICSTPDTGAWNQVPIDNSMAITRWLLQARQGNL